MAALRCVFGRCGVRGARDLPRSIPAILSLATRTPLGDSAGTRTPSALESAPKVAPQEYTSFRSFASSSVSDGESDGEREKMEAIDLRRQLEEELGDEESQEEADTPTTAEDVDGGEGVQLPGLRGTKWIELSALPKAVFPLDVRKFLSENDVSLAAHEPMRVQLNESLDVTSWYVPLMNQADALAKLQGKSLGLLRVQSRALSATQAQKMVAQTEVVLPDGSEYVSLTNVPDGTTWLDVKDFFRGYNIVCGSGIQELRDKLRVGHGGPQGSGRSLTKKFLVRFTSSMEAFNAVQFKSHRPFFDRRAMVSLMFCTSENLQKAEAEPAAEKDSD